MGVDAVYTDSDGLTGGLSLGAANHEEVAVFSQQQTKLNQHKYDTEIVKLDIILKSKKGQVDSNIQMATLYQKMGQVERAVGRMEIVEELMKQISSLETVMYEMK